MVNLVFFYSYLQKLPRKTIVSFRSVQNNYFWLLFAEVAEIFFFCFIQEYTRKLFLIFFAEVAEKIKFTIKLVLFFAYRPES